MDFDEYQRRALACAVYPDAIGKSYTALALAGEAGEVANVVKKWMRGDFGEAELRRRLSGELGGVLWYLAALAAEMGFSLSEIAEGSIETVERRRREGTTHGDGER